MNLPLSTVRTHLPVSLDHQNLARSDSDEAVTGEVAVEAVSVPETAEQSRIIILLRP